VPGFITLRLEPAGGAIILARAGRVGVARRSRGIARHGRSCGRYRGRIPLDEPENTKRIVRNKMGSKEPRRNQRSPPPASAGVAPFGLVAGRVPVAATCHGAFGSTSTGEKELRLAKAWEADDLMKD
jgi:hypothetical protein